MSKISEKNSQLLKLNRELKKENEEMRKLLIADFVVLQSESEVPEGFAQDKKFSMNYGFADLYASHHNKELEAYTAKYKDVAEDDRPPFEPKPFTNKYRYCYNLKIFFSGIGRQQKKKIKTKQGEKLVDNLRHIYDLLIYTNEVVDVINVGDRIQVFHPTLVRKNYFRKTKCKKCKNEIQILNNDCFFKANWEDIISITSAAKIKSKKECSKDCSACGSAEIMHGEVYCSMRKNNIHHYSVEVDNERIVRIGEV